MIYKMAVVKGEGDEDEGGEEDDGDEDGEEKENLCIMYMGTTCQLCRNKNTI